MSDFSDIRIFLCTTLTKMNYGLDRLMGRAQEIFDQDPTPGHLSLFLDRDRDRMKILFWIVMDSVSGTRSKNKAAPGSSSFQDLGPAERKAKEHEKTLLLSAAS